MHRRLFGYLSYHPMFGLIFRTRPYIYVRYIQIREDLRIGKNLGKIIRIDQCCGSRPFWYGSGSCFSLWSGSGSWFSIWYGSESDRLIRIRIITVSEVMYLKQYFLLTFTWFSLSLCPTGLTQKVFFVNFPFLIIFFVPFELLTDPDSDPRHPRERIRILKNYPDPQHWDWRI